jgi:predicted nucleic acid-binding protein
MTIVVNDANVLIDLVKLSLLPQFFSLNLTFYTSDFILGELNDSQREQLNIFIEQDILKVIELNDTEIVDIAMLQAQRPKLSTQDCSAIVCTQKVGGGLLTSDNALRKFAKSKSIEVHGHLWIFDQLVANGKITTITATQKLRELVEVVNTKLNLPKFEVESRLEKWKQ